MGKKSDILQVAQRLFAQFGLKKVTTDDIAKMSSVSKATIYRYYKNKEEIFDEVVKIEGAQLLDAVNEAVDKEETVIDKFRAYLLTKIGKIHELINFYRATREMMNDYWPYIAEAREQFMEREKEMVLGVLELGNSTNELCVERADLAAHIIVVSLKSLEYPWAIEEHDISLSDYVDLLLDILINGIRKR